ncbi:hypothetical protein [Kitasatospora sp. NPDC057015]|uniref:hypothetical protein n=1 Tax=Kitasatospora sp. NPDC057015 TaxID=3346001 RepID=UPI00362F5AE9
MAKVKVSIVHDQAGRIMSVARPAEKVVVLSGDGQSVFETEVEEDSVVELAGGSHRVDVQKNSIVGY